MRRRTLRRPDRWQLIGAAIVAAGLVVLLLLLAWPATPARLCDDPSVRDRPGCTLAGTTTTARENT